MSSRSARAGQGAGGRGQGRSVGPRHFVGARLRAIERPGRCDRARARSYNGSEILRELDQTPPHRQHLPPARPQLTPMARCASNMPSTTARRWSSACAFRARRRRYRLDGRAAFARALALLHGIAGVSYYKALVPERIEIAGEPFDPDLADLLDET